VSGPSEVRKLIEAERLINLAKLRGPVERCNVFDYALGAVHALTWSEGSAVASPLDMILDLIDSERCEPTGTTIGDMLHAAVRRMKAGDN